MEKTQWLESGALAELQSRRLTEFMRTVSEQVPYYRRLFQKYALDPASFQEPADLSSLPFLDKAVIRQHVCDLKSENAQRLEKSNTGGSTGEPLIFYLGSQRVGHDVAAKWRATRWWGVDIGDPEIVFWGSPIELGAQDFMRAARDRIFRTRLLSAFDLSEETMHRYISLIQARKPRMLFGYPSVLAYVAQYAENNRLRLDCCGIKVIFVTSERLYDWQREVIERNYGSPVANGYGGRDAGFIAHECPAGGMHITAEDIVVEIIDDQGGRLPNGQYGEVVVTHLASGDFPFIRYKTGDVAAVSDEICRCGRGLPLLCDVQGRSTDFIRAADGKLLHGLALIYVVREQRGIETFKIIQEDENQIRVMIVPNAAYEEDAGKAIINGIKSRVGMDVSVDVEVRSSIEKEGSGKYRYVVSRLTGH